jgi:hypothetical protein
VITYRATLDVPRGLVAFVAGLLHTHRWTLGTLGRSPRCPLRGSRPGTTHIGRFRVRKHRSRRPHPGKEAGRRAPLHVDNRAYNMLLRSMRCLGERGFALLTQRWRVLQGVTTPPTKIGDIAKAAIVLLHFEHGY